MSFFEPIVYSLITTQVTCACGSVMTSVRLHGRFKTDQGQQGRPLGKSEIIYLDTPIERYVVTQGTPACEQCFDSVVKQPRLVPLKQTLHRVSKPSASIDIDDLDLS